MTTTTCTLSFVIDCTEASVYLFYLCLFLAVGAVWLSVDLWRFVKRRRRGKR